MKRCSAYQCKIGLTRIKVTGIQLLGKSGKVSEYNLSNERISGVWTKTDLDGAKVSWSPQFGSPFRVPRINAGAMFVLLLLFISSTWAFKP